MSDDPQTCSATAMFAVNLRAAMGSTSVQSLAIMTGIETHALAGILDGKVTPDLYEMALLEHSLQSDLWPGSMRAHHNS